MRTHEYAPTINIIKDPFGLNFCIGSCAYIIFNPGDYVVLEGSLDQLVEKIRR